MCAHHSHSGNAGGRRSVSQVFVEMIGVYSWDLKWVTRIPAHPQRDYWPCARYTQLALRGAGLPRCHPRCRPRLLAPGVDCARELGLALL